MGSSPSCFLQEIIGYMKRKQNSQIAKQFNDELKLKGILSYEELVKLTVLGQFEEFKEQYYQYLSNPQQKQFKIDYEIIQSSFSLLVQFEYEVHTPSINLNNVEKEFYFLVIGITGNGKTTFINSLYNALTIENKKYLQSGVRKLLVDDRIMQISGQSVTKEINSYSIFINRNSKIYKINIIDTPGLNDTSGLEQDLTMIDQLGNYLLKKVPCLDLLLLVSKEQEKYTFQEELSMQSIVKLLGINTPQYTKQILTFSELTQNINYDKFNDSILKVFYEKQQAPKYHQFQNSLMFISGSVTFLQQKRLQKNLKNFKKFIGSKFINNSNSDFLDLSLTQEVIIFRRQIKEFLYQLGRNLKVLVMKLIANKNNQLTLNSCQNQILKCGNFTYKKQVVERYVTNCQEGYTATYCRVCDITCHDRCEIQYEKAGCIVFRNKKCYSSNCGHLIADHESLDIIINYVNIEKTFEYQEMKQQFNQVLTFQQQLELQIEELYIEQDNIREQICKVLAFVKLRDQELRKSALFHDIRSNAVEFYLNEIKNQNQQQKIIQNEIDLISQQFQDRESQYTQIAEKQLLDIENQ